VKKTYKFIDGSQLALSLTNLTSARQVGIEGAIFVPSFVHVNARRIKVLRNSRITPIMCILGDVTGHPRCP